MTSHFLEAVRAAFPVVDGCSSSGGGGGSSSLLGAAAVPFPGLYGHGAPSWEGDHRDFYARGGQVGDRQQLQQRRVYPWMAVADPSRRRGRQTYSRHQTLELEKEFHYGRYPTLKRRVEVSGALGLTERQIKIWFQNRRMKWKRERSVFRGPEAEQPDGRPNDGSVAAVAAAVEGSADSGTQGGGKDKAIKQRKQRGS